MRIFFRYLFTRLLQTFLICLTACTIIWIMADLYGNMDDFLDHKVNFLLILRFYSLQIPKMLVQVLPAAMLFSTLFTLLSLNRRCELVALQSGGMAPLWMFSPFFLFAAIWVAILFYDMSGPAAQAEVTRDRLLKQVKGQAAGRNQLENLMYVDRANRLVWFFDKLDSGSGKGEGMSILQRDANGQDIWEYDANHGQWTGSFWRLTGVKRTDYSPDGSVLTQKTMAEVDLPDITTPPKQLSLIVSQPDQLTVAQLSSYIHSSTQSADYLAQYRTEWWYRILYPFSILVLILFALIQGARTDRRSAIAGVGVAIVVLLIFTMGMNVFMAIGRGNRMPPFLAVSATMIIFGAIGLHFLAIGNGWYWQAQELWRYLYETYFDRGEELDDATPPSETGPVSP
jgi:lipopolysaccharide export system permease protein